MSISKGGARAAIFPPMATAITMVSLGLMPPGSSLTSTEARLYSEVLKADYKDRMIEFLVTGVEEK
ncbi:MAG: hypothetical protein NTV34_01215 [Proteobacteria bacterium]|nr:hypothetical protein [Pseudomonadota bacterium]